MYMNEVLVGVSMEVVGRGLRVCVDMRVSIQRRDL